jgi:hypothetical protein
MINVADSVSAIRRTPALVFLVVGLLAAALSIFGDFWKWPALAGGVVSAVLFIAQYVRQGNVAVKFTVNDWVKKGGTFEFLAGRYHGKGKIPKVTVYIPSLEGGYEEVVCDIRTLESGEVIIGAGKPFVGQVRIS